MRKRKVLFILIGLALPTFAFADGALFAPPSAAVSDFKYSAYIDGSYNYLLRSNEFTSGTYNRTYDLARNGFTLQQLAGTLAYQPAAGFGGFLNVITGRDANDTAPYGYNPYYGSQTLAMDPLQAYLQYAVGSLTIIGGRFESLAGAEYVDPTLNTNYSHSIVFGYAEPTTLLGIRGTYVLNNELTLVAGINNGWDNIRDISRRKTVELSTIYAPTSLFSLATTFYSGGQRAINRTPTGPESILNLLDIVATFNATDKLTLIGNYDFGNQTLAALPSGNIAQAVWQGLAAYANYKFTDQWQTSVRGEVYSDRNGYQTGVVQCWKELTLTLGYTPIKNLELRAETRHDFSNVSSFVSSHSGSTSNNQQSYALEAYYKFA